MSYQAIYYRDSSAVEPVRDIIGALGATCRESVHWKIGLLNKLASTNPELPDPHSSALKGKDYRAFRELRAHCALSRHRGSSHPYARTSGITQQQLATAIGTTASAISRLESGEHPVNFETVSKLGSALGITFAVGSPSGAGKNCVVIPERAVEKPRPRVAASSGGYVAPTPVYARGR